MTPRPASFMPSAMPSSSSSEARSDGVGSPLTVRWFSVREVEAQRAVAHRLRRQRAHLRHFFGGRFFQPGRALAHHEDAQRAVRQLGAEVHVARLGVERVEILAERLP